MTTTVAIQLNNDEIQKLDQMAESTHWTRSDVIRFLISSAGEIVMGENGIEEEDDDDETWLRLFAHPHSDQVLSQLADQARNTPQSQLVENW